MRSIDVSPGGGPARATDRPDPRGRRVSPPAGMIGAWRRAGRTSRASTRLDVFGPRTGGSAEDARQAGDDGVDGLDKITAQMPGGEHRPEQQEMCRAVAEALVTGTHLVVQAGTGTGKSLAYLVPAALSGKKVVVATATKALQDQLAQKDLPMVEAGLGLPAPLDYAVLKGRSNYICRQRVAEVGSGGIQPELGDEGAEPADEREAAGADEGDGAGCRAARGPRRRGAHAGGLVAGLGHRRPGRPELRAVRPGLEHGERRARASARAPTTAPREGAASPRRPATGRRRPTSSSSTPTSTAPTWPAAAWCCPSTTWSSSTRRTSSRRS